MLNFSLLINAVILSLNYLVLILHLYTHYLSYKHYFYCVNTSYPMDNCFTGRRDRSRQTSEKDVLYRFQQDRSQSVHSPGGTWYFISCLPIDVIASFSFGAKECAEDFLQRYVFEVLQRTLLSFLFFISTE